MATTRIILKKSGIQGKLPVAANAEFGELFVNYHSGNPMVAFKDNAGNIVTLKPVKVIDGGAGETPPGTGNSVGDTIWDGTNLLVWNGSQWVPVGVADLSYTAKVDGGTVVSANGTDAEIPLVGVNAGLMAPGDKTKLDGVTAGAEPNVKPDWNAAGGTDAEILNKPDIPTNTSDLFNDGDGTSDFVTFDDIGGLGGGSVTSVDSGDGLDGGPITTSGTLSVKPDGDTITVSPDGIKVTDNKFAAPGDIPTSTSELTNDGDGTSNFVTFDDIGGLGGGSVTSVDSGDGLTGGPVTTTGTLSVQADGDTIAVSAAGIKVADGKFAEPGDLPTKTSELTNDGANGTDPFITANDLPAPPDLSGYLELDGGNLTGGVTQTERAVGAAAGEFDLSKGNFWSCGLADVPAPTNGVNGQSGLIRFTGVVNSWDAAFKNTPTSVEAGDIIPFYVEGPASIALGTKNVTGSVAGFWTRDGGTSTLSPANAGDDVDLGAGDLSAADGTFSGLINADGYKQRFNTADANFGVGIPDSTGVNYYYFVVEKDDGTFPFRFELDGDAKFSDGNITLNANGSAYFAGSITAQNVTFGLTPEQQTTYGLPELDIKDRILNFITRIEQLEARVAELEGGN